jgi:hypothetical protein
MNPNDIPEQAGTRNEAGAAVPALFSGKDWITVEEAVVLFQDIGLPRTAEAIRGYCRKGKIEASSMEGAKGDQHMIRTESARAFIEERKIVLDALGQNVPEHAGTMRKLPVVSVTSRNVAEDAVAAETDGSAANAAALADKVRAQETEIEALRRETRTLEIDKRVREQMLERVDADRQLLLGKVLEMGTEVGQLRERVAHLQLAAPDAVRPAASPAPAVAPETPERSGWDAKPPSWREGDNPPRESSRPEV